jgi:hypothetical protein
MSIDTGYRRSKVAAIRAFEVFGSRVLQASISACSGPYLDRLVQDYVNWATGKPRLQGSIRPEAKGLLLDTEATALPGFEQGVPRTNAP